jgi:hypothetical protein
MNLLKTKNEIKKIFNRKKNPHKTNKKAPRRHKFFKYSGNTEKNRERQRIKNTFLQKEMDFLLKLKDFP